EDAGFVEVRAPDEHRLRVAHRLLDQLAEQTLAPELAERHAALARAVGGAGTLELELTPAGTPARLVRVESDAEGILVERPLDEVSPPGPGERLALARGSYVLVCGEAPGPVVRVPFLLERNEQERVRLALPPRIPHGMAYVPAGTPLIGGADGRFRKLSLEGFFVDLHEVTLAEWREFLAANGAPAAAIPYVGRTPMLDAQLEPGWFRDYPLQLEGPVFGVTPAAVEAYCAWRSAGSELSFSLPSEAEWEYAIRGADGRSYPWGDRFDPARCNTELAPSKRPDESWWAAVGRFPADRGPFGLLDGAGNVAEYTSSRYGRGGARDSVVIKGGAFSTKQGELAAVSFRQAVGPDSYSPSVGFRVIARPRR
ncbi:MAG: SUMF1/EgtB/PvdO family nonheme iron enzyme, partial [Planctomycetes bacterium]|nr:SUMF1/EgtB/PvdO family nonheme iron enzyme [Planctomycetota bacterium]